MYTSYARHQLHIHWRKIVLIGLILFGHFYSSSAQNNPSENLIHYQDQWIHYGFLIGLHTSRFIVDYNDAYTSDALDTLHSVVPGSIGGFKVGFLANMRIAEYLDFRGSITVGFYENDLTYRMTDGSNVREVKDATMVEMPLLLKYRSARRGNIAMYMLAGINPSLEAAGSTDERDITEKLELRNVNIAFDVGFGLDMYQPYFKFSPEIRYSIGLRNMLNNSENQFSAPLQRLTTHNFTLFLTFEGGPNNKRKLGKQIKGPGQNKTRKRRKKQSK